MNVFTTSTFGPANNKTNSADDFIRRAQQAGHYPTKLETVSDFPIAGVPAAGYNALIGTYPEERRVLGINGSRYNATGIENWNGLIRAAVAAGAKPIHSHAWAGKVIAQFEVCQADGLRSTLILGDSFDGSCRLMAGENTTRLTCANQLSSVVRSEHDDWAKIRHTASLEEKTRRLEAGIAETLKRGRRVHELFQRASNVYLPPKAAKIAFNAFFPEPSEDDTPTMTTKKTNKRLAARIAAAMPINRVGCRPGNLATLWNSATYLVDRRCGGCPACEKIGAKQGDAVEMRSGDAVNSMLFGARGKRVTECLELIEVVLADGTVEEMTVTEAQDHGVNVGSKLLESVLAQYN